MAQPLQTLRCALSALVACTLSAHSAFAQGTPPSTATAPDPAATDAGNESDHFCRDHWLAMGRCRDRTWTGPELMLGIDLGVSAMNETGPFGFNDGVGTATDPGPAWGARVGVELLPWLALEARYVGMYNAARSPVSPAGSVGYLTTGGEAVVRFTAPLPFVHPYIFGGVGYYDSSLLGSSSAKAGSVLNSSSEAGAPMGFGLDVPLTWHLSIGAEATYHFLIHESFSADTTNGIDGGDFSTFNAVLRARL